MRGQPPHESYGHPRADSSSFQSAPAPTIALPTQTELPAQAAPELLQAVASSPPRDPGAAAAAEANVAAEWKVDDIILGLYEVKQIHEGGGMGLVYRVYHRGWNTDLAVKSPRVAYFQSKAQKANFTRECETWIKLGLHPHIVSCYYVRNLGEIPRVFAEYVEGGSLREWIDSRKLYEGGPQEALKRILDIALQMARGLHYAHEQGVIHQDVKPANVMMLSDGTTKVTDFGLAKARAATWDTAAGDEPRSILASSAGMTPAYCSPEQAEIAAMRRSGQPEERIPKLTQRTDIWSWGVSVLEMFYCGPPCPAGGQAAGEVLEAFLSTPPDVGALPAMSREMAKLMRACFERNPESRPKSFGVLADRLREIYRKQTGEDYARAEPSAMELRADGLNNRAVSLLDLDREDEGLEVFEQAMKIEPGHLESIYNRGLILWRRAKITDQRLLASIREANASQGSSGRGKHLLGLVHLERGDAEGAVSELEEVAIGAQVTVELQHLLKRAQSQKVGFEPVPTFDGHTNKVRSIATTADGRWALSGSEDLTLRLWDLVSRRCLRTLQGHTHHVGSVAISAGGRWGVSACYTSLRFWDLTTGHCLRTLEAHSRGERFSNQEPVAISPDDRWVLSGGTDKTLRLWEWATGICVRRFAEHTDGISCVGFLPNGRWALSGSFDKTIRLWDLSTGRCERAFHGHTHAVNCIAISPSGRWILSGSDDKTLRLWDVATGRCVKIFEGDSKEIRSVAISPDSHWALSGSGSGFGTNGALRLWELATGRCACTIVESDAVTPVAIFLDGRGGLSGSKSGAIRQWKLPTRNAPSPHALCRPTPTAEHGSEGARFRRCMQEAKEALANGRWSQAAVAIKQARNCTGYDLAKEALDAWCNIGRVGLRANLARAWCVRVLEDHTQSVSSVAISPDGQLILSAGDDKILRVWDSATGKCVRKWRHTCGEDAVAIFCNPQCGIVGGKSDVAPWDGSGGGPIVRARGAIRLWDLPTGSCIQTLEDLPYLHDVNSLATSPDKRWVLLGGGGCFDYIHEKYIEGLIGLWSLADGRCAWSEALSEECVTAVAISPDGRWALSGSSDEQDSEQAGLRLWQLATGMCLRRFEGHTDKVNCVAISPDGRWALSGGTGDQTIRLWEVATGKCAGRFEGHTGDVSCIAISSDGRWVLSGSDDGTLRLWEVSTGRCVHTFASYVRCVSCVAFSPDSRWILWSGIDTTVRLYELDWEYDFPDQADWDDGARPFLEIFLTMHSPLSADGLSRIGRPLWSEEDFQELLLELQHRGYGWLSSDGVRQQLRSMGAAWQGGPTIPGIQSS